MITLQVAEYCQKCVDFEPCVEKLYADCKVAIQTVYCKDRERCANIYESLREKVEMDISKTND